MREIKFRAWDGERMYWNVQDAYDTLHDHSPPGSNLSDEEKDKYILFSESFGHLLKLGGYKVMQFTGLKDKNGKEIYEGDIVHYNELILSLNKKQKIVQGSDAVQIDEVGVVMWDVKGASFDIEMKNVVRGFGARGDVDMEVIGNIYENPELIKNGVKSFE